MENYLLLYRSGVPFCPNFVVFVVDWVVIGEIIMQQSTHVSWYCIITL